MSLPSEVTSVVCRSLFHVFHSKSGLFCGLTMAGTLAVRQSPQGFLWQEQILP